MWKKKRESYEKQKETAESDCEAHPGQFTSDAPSTIWDAAAVILDTQTSMRIGTIIWIAAISMIIRSFSLNPTPVVLSDDSAAGIPGFCSAHHKALCVLVKERNLGRPEGQTFLIGCMWEQEVKLSSFFSPFFPGWIWMNIFYKDSGQIQSNGQDY